MSADLHGFFDDAALFPPASLPMPQAVAAHLLHRQAWYRQLVGPFVCPARRIPELGSVPLEAPLAVSLTLPDGPQTLATALRACAGLGSIQLAAAEVALPAGVGLQAALAMMDDQVPQGVVSYLEVPRDGRRHAVLDALAGTRHRAKFRTGGVEPQAHPAERELADVVVGAVRRAVPFKCTAGLHHAVRHTDGKLEQHGFLNVLLAVDAATAGADMGAVAALLARRSVEDVGREAARAAASGRLTAARSHVISIGTCSIDDPVADLVGLGLLSRPKRSSRDESYRQESNA